VNVGSRETEGGVGWSGKAEMPTRKEVQIRGRRGRERRMRGRLSRQLQSQNSRSQEKRRREEIKAEGWKRAKRR
jgi:hypothetical protein